MVPGTGTGTVPGTGTGTVPGTGTGTGRERERERNPGTQPGLEATAKPGKAPNPDKPEATAKPGKPEATAKPGKAPDPDKPEVTAKRVEKPSPSDARP